MSKLNERLKLLRFEKGISQQELSNFIGMSKSSINMYERGEREPGVETMEAFADFFNVDMDYLVGKSDFKNKHAWLESVNTPKQIIPDNVFPVTTRRFPLLGDIACGEPIYANEDRESYIEAGTDIRADFCLRAHGDSMEPRIHENDIVFIREQPQVENGEIAAVIIDDSATLKRIYRNPDSIVLISENPRYQPMVYNEYSGVTMKILGKAIAFQRDL